MCLRLVISSFYHGLALCYRYTLDVVAGRDIFQCNENEAFDAIKKLITIYNMPSKSNSSFINIYARLKTIENHTIALKDCYNMLREHHDYVPINFELSKWFPIIK